MKTELFETHKALGARIVDFAGWEMPLSYQGVVAEHLAVRDAVGVFDVSHMGRILIKGPDAEAVLDYASTNVIAGRPDGSATYTVWPTESGGCVDDTIVYRTSEQEFFTVANASNRQKDLQHIQMLAKGKNVEILTTYDSEGILAVQGPKAMKVLRKLFPGDWRIKPFHYVPMTFAGTTILVSRTGYTGSGGVELIAPNGVLHDLWDRLFDIGREEGIQPIGLAARDTLRLESGYALYGHELSDKIAPNESVSAWTVKWTKEFIGRGAMAALEASEDKRSQYGVKLVDKGVPREGCPVWAGGKELGIVTSGSFSPCCDAGIAIVMLKGNFIIGDEVSIQVRQRKLKAHIVKLPFFSTPKKT